MALHASKQHQRRALARGVAPAKNTLSAMQAAGAAMPASEATPGSDVASASDDGRARRSANRWGRIYGRNNVGRQRLLREQRLSGATPSGETA